MSATGIIGMWAVVCDGQPLLCFTTKAEATNHAARLSIARAGHELLIAWTAGVVSMKEETAEMIAAREASEQRFGTGPYKFKRRAA